MREWILENTDVTAEEYDKLINPYMIKYGRFSKSRYSIYTMQTI